MDEGLSGFLVVGGGLENKLLEEQSEGYGKGCSVCFFFFFWRYVGWRERERERNLHPEKSCYSHVWQLSKKVSVEHIRRIRKERPNGKALVWFDWFGLPGGLCMEIC